MSKAEEQQAWLVCELEDGVTGGALATEVRVRLLSEAGALIEEQTSDDGACRFTVAPGSYAVIVAFPNFDVEYRFRRVFACAGNSTPVQMAIDLVGSKGNRKASDFDVPCEGF